MPNAFFPENPNHVNKSRDDARSSLGACPRLSITDVFAQVYAREKTEAGKRKTFKK
ncbi:hypothetical protein [Pseudomonas weihenstephanensis]|uniref:hypothetical protein n=1 Tax=Pseudomonas weihenstephanensis TaxID=1608994 RepID=UPI000AF40CF4|nr:hypothetical protein [Pseudomonas weihenstephanensis]MBM1193147.1 hypothetical protein [Pseudomonas weihenstephanensis]GLX91360.1 hypothetical protein Pfra02_39280 [Pseudomonas fragi]